MRLLHLHVTGCLLVFILILQLSSTRLLPKKSLTNDTYLQDLYKDIHFINQTQQISNSITSKIFANQEKLNRNQSTNQAPGLSPTFVRKQSHQHLTNSLSTDKLVLFKHHFFKILNPSTTISSQKTKKKFHPKRDHITPFLQRLKWSFKKEGKRFLKTRRKLPRRFPFLKNVTKFYLKILSFSISKKPLDGSVKKNIFSKISSDTETKNLNFLPSIIKTISFSNFSSQSYFSKIFSNTSKLSLVSSTRHKSSVASKKNFFQTGYYLTSPVADISLNKTNKSNRRINKTNLFKITRKLLKYNSSEYAQSFPENNLYFSLLNFSRKDALIKKPKKISNNNNILKLDKKSTLIKDSKYSKNVSPLQPSSLSSTPPPTIKPSNIPSFPSKPEFDSHNSTEEQRLKRSLLQNPLMKKIRKKRNFSKRDLSIFRNDYERRARLHNPLSASFLSVDDDGKIVSDPYLNSTSVIELIIWCVLPQSPLHPCSRPNYNVVLLRFVDTGLFLCTDRFAQLYTFKSLELKNLEECAFKHGTVFNSYDVYYSWKYPRRKLNRHRLNNAMNQNRKFKNRIFKNNKVQRKFGKINKVKNGPYTSSNSSLNNQIMKKQNFKNNTLIIHYINDTKINSKKDNFHLKNDTTVNTQHLNFHNHLPFNRSQKNPPHYINQNSSRHHKYRFSQHHLWTHQNDQQKSHQSHHHNHHTHKRPAHVDNIVVPHYRRRTHHHSSQLQPTANTQPSTIALTSSSVPKVTIEPKNIDLKASGVTFISTLKNNGKDTEDKYNITRNESDKHSTLGIPSRYSTPKPPHHFETSDPTKNFVNNEREDNKPVENSFPFLKLTVLDNDDESHNDEPSRTDENYEAKKFNEFDEIDSNKHQKKKYLQKNKISYLKNNIEYDYNSNDNELNKEKNFDGKENPFSILYPISNESLAVDNKTNLIKNNQTKNNLVNKTESINSIKDNTNSGVSESAIESFGNRASQPIHTSLPFTSSFSLSAILISYSSKILNFLGLRSSESKHAVRKNNTKTLSSTSNIFFTNQTSEVRSVVASSFKQYYDSDDKTSVKNFSEKNSILYEHLQTPLSQKLTQNSTFHRENANTTTQLSNKQHYFKHLPELAAYKTDYHKNSNAEHVSNEAAPPKAPSKYFLRTNKKIQVHKKMPQNNDEFKIIRKYNLTNKSTGFSGRQTKLPQKDSLVNMKHHHIRRNANKIFSKFHQNAISKSYDMDKLNHKNSLTSSSILSPEQQKQLNFIFQHQEQQINSQLKHKRSASKKQEKKRWYIGINEKGEVKIFKVKASQDNRVLFIKGWLNAQELQDLKTTLENKTQIRDRNSLLNAKSSQLYHSEVQNLQRHYRFRHRPSHKKRLSKGTSPSLLKTSRQGTNVLKRRRVFADGNKHKNKNSNNLCNSLLRNNC